MERTLSPNGLRQELRRYISLSTIVFSSIRFTAETLEECKTLRGTCYQKSIQLTRCTFDADPTPLFQLFKRSQEDHTKREVYIHRCTAPNDDWTSACHAISELGWPELTLDGLTDFALYSALRGLMNHPLEKLSLDHCTFTTGQPPATVPVLCNVLDVRHCRFDTPLPSTFPQTTQLFIGDETVIHGVLPAIESMTQLTTVSLIRVDVESFRMIIEHLHTQTEMEFSCVFMEGVTRHALDPFATWIKRSRATKFTVEFYECEGSSEDMLTFLKQIQFEPVELGPHTCFNDPEGTKDWPAMIEWYNDRVKANRQFLASLYHRRREASDQPLLSDLPAAMRHVIYEQYVGGPFTMDI